MSEILRVEAIKKSYTCGDERIDALKGVSFRLEQGEMLAIMGGSGSGKSTMLHIIGALDSPDSGKVYLNHVYKKDYCKEPYATKIRYEYIGFIFQQFNLLSDLTVSENIALPLMLNNYRKDTILEYTDRKLKLVGLENRRNHRPFELSGGQQQRVAIARALITNPKILLADEPTGNLDINTAKEIMSLLYDMNKSLNQSTIVVTHDPVVASYADRVIFFHDGELIDEYKNVAETGNNSDAKSHNCVGTEQLRNHNIEEILSRFRQNIEDQSGGGKWND